MLRFIGRDALHGRAQPLVISALALETCDRGAERLADATFDCVLDSDRLERAPAVPRDTNRGHAGTLAFGKGLHDCGVLDLIASSA